MLPFLYLLSFQIDYYRLRLLISNITPFYNFQELEQATEELEILQAQLAQKKKEALELMKKARDSNGHSGPTDKQKKLFRE